MDVLTLPAAIAIAGLGVTAFALIRRLMRANEPPRWLANDAMAYLLALAMTGYIALSMMALTVALMPVIKGAFLAGASSIAAHVALWMIARLVIPLGVAGHGDTLAPPPARAA